jgi:hypothetical protein
VVLPADDAAKAIGQTVQGATIIQPYRAAVLRDLDADLAAYQKATGQ